MPPSSFRRRAAGYGRAILFSSGLLAASLGASYLHIRQGGVAKLAERQHPAGWPISFQLPEGWKTRNEELDLFGGRQRHYTDESKVRFLSVRFLPLMPGIKPETLSRWAVQDGWPIPQQRLRAAEVEEFKVNGRPAALLRVWQPQTEEWLPFEVQVVGIVPGERGGGYCYTVEHYAPGGPDSGISGMLKAVAGSIREVDK
jgi:hypothetical protein